MIMNPNEILDKLEAVCAISKQVETVVNRGYLKRDYQSIFLGEPDKICMDIILDYGGVIIDHRVEHGVLFGVPKEWILDDNTEIHNNLFGKEIGGTARLLILDDYPILIYTLYNDKVYKDDVHDTEFTECHTHAATSIVRLPIQKNKRNDDEY